MTTFALPKTTPIAKMYRSFPGLKEKSNGWHEHRASPKFDCIETLEGNIIIHSWTGRSTENILELGTPALQMNDLYAGAGTRSKQVVRDKLDLLTLAHYMKIDWQYLEQLGYRDGYSYISKNGQKTLCVKIGGYCLPDGSEHSKKKVRLSVDEKPRFLWDQNTPGEPIPYGLHKLNTARNAGYLFIGEGESDGATMWFHEMPYLGISGASAFKRLDVSLLEGIERVYIIEEPDQVKSQGELGFYGNLREYLRANGYLGKIFSIRWKDATGYKDPSELHKALYRECEQQEETSFRAAVMAKFKTAIEQALTAALPEGNETLEYQRNGDETAFILECLEQDEAGDAALFAHIFKGKVIYDTTVAEWYLYKKHYWEIDTCSTVKLYVSGKLASTYLQTAAAINLKAKTINDDDEETVKLKTTIKALTARALSLRKASRINNVLSLVIPQKHMHIISNFWDSNPQLLPVQNGIVDLRTGQLRDGLPEDYVRTASPTKWEGLNAPALHWERILQEIFEDREPGERNEVIDFLQRTLGYGITGMVNEEIFLVLYGEDGRNGKDTIIGRIERVLGPLAGVVPNEVFLSTGRFHLAGSATPHLVALQGKRLAWSEEPENGARFNASQVKALTGGGSISARQLFGRQYTFDPTHLLLLLTNHKPHADAHDSAFWARLRLITFNMRFVDNPDPNNPHERKPDKTLKKALEAEASGILAWLVRGCLAWQAEGLNAPASVLNDGKQYQQEEDNIARFFDECCVIQPEFSARANLLYKRYSEWCKDGNMHALSSKIFGTHLGKKFPKKKAAQGFFYYGIGVLEDGGMRSEDTMHSPSPDFDADENTKDYATPPAEPIYEQGNAWCACKTAKVPIRDDEISKMRNFVSSDCTPCINTTVIDPLKALVEQDEGTMHPPYATMHVTAEINHTMHTPRSDDGQRASPPSEHLALLHRLKLHLQETWKKEEIFWFVDGSGFSPGFVTLPAYFTRLERCLKSEKSLVVEATLEQMRNKLGIGA